MKTEGDAEQSYQIEAITKEWHQAFRIMHKYYEHEGFRNFRTEYDPSTWYEFKNPALIYPAERAMRFSTPNTQIPFDYYPSRLAKCGIMGHNFAYLADIGEYYPYTFPEFLGEQKEFITPLQRANVRAAHFMPDALVAYIKEGLRSFLQAKGENKGFGAYEDPLVILEMLGLMGMPRSDDILTFFKELSEENAFDTFLETPYIFSFAGIVTPPSLNDDKRYGIRRRDGLAYVKTLVSRYIKEEMGYNELSTELEKVGYTVTIGDEGYNPEDSVDLRWVKLDYAMERVKGVIAEYEHKAAHSNYNCYADLAEALKRIYEKEETVCSLYS
jgi:hypothetical protein